MSQPARAGPRPGEQSLALSALLLGAVAVGASAIFVRLSELGALPSAFYRPFLAIPAVWLWLRLFPTAAAPRNPKGLRDIGRLLLAGGLFAGDLAFWHLSLHHTTVANATLFANSGPVFVVLGGWLIFRHRVTPVFLLGMALAIIGAACLARGSFAIEPGNLLGDAYGVATAIFFASYLITVQRLRAAFTTATLMTWTSIWTSVVLLPVALATGEPMLSASLAGWTVLLALALVSHVMGQGLIVYAAAHLPASLASVTLLFEPVAAALLAWAILAEAPTAWQVLGGTIILSGIAIARRG